MSADPENHEEIIKAAKDLRRAVGALSEDEREKLRNRAMAIIYEAEDAKRMDYLQKQFHDSGDWDKVFSKAKYPYDLRAAIDEEMVRELKLDNNGVH